MNFEVELQDRVNKIELMLKELLPEIKGNQSIILEAMDYSLMAGGKRIRPLLMQEVYHLYGGEGKVIEYFMMAMELIHTYSLVHDDLPAMDDDDYRRGRKTTHIVYGEDMGILTGDGLLNYAFEMIGRAFDEVPERSLQIGKAMQVLSKKAGVYGMIGGQVIDVKHTGQPLSQELLDEIFRLKTGALIEASMMVGAILAGADISEVEKMEQVGASIGMAFQIQDDILDVTSTSEVLGKPVLSDEKNDKTTYVTLIGLEESKKWVEKHSELAIDLLNTLQQDTKFLKKLVEMLIHRQK